MNVEEDGNEMSEGEKGEEWWEVIAETPEKKQMIYTEENDEQAHL